MYISFVENSHHFLALLLKTIVQNYIVYPFFKVPIHSAATQLWPTLIVTTFRLTYSIKPSPFTAHSDTRYHILIFSCYIPIHITKRYFTNCATQIMKRKEMLCTAIFWGAWQQRQTPQIFSVALMRAFIWVDLWPLTIIIPVSSETQVNRKAPIHVRQVCLWPAKSTTNITQSILPAIANLHTLHFLKCCLVATQPDSVVSSTAQQMDCDLPVHRSYFVWFFLSFLGIGQT